jgi:hypothetical protein
MCTSKARRVHPLVLREAGSDCFRFSCREPIMPFKFHSKGRRHIPRQRHRVTNWREYDAALRNLGSLTVWVTPDATAGRRRNLEQRRRSASLFGSRRRNCPDFASGVSIGAVGHARQWHSRYRRHSGSLAVGVRRAKADSCRFCRCFELRVSSGELLRLDPQGHRYL